MNAAKDSGSMPKFPRQPRRRRRVILIVLAVVFGTALFSLVAFATLVAVVVSHIVAAVLASDWSGLAGLMTIAYAAWYSCALWVAPVPPELEWLELLGFIVGLPLYTLARVAALFLR